MQPPRRTRRPLRSSASLITLALVAFLLGDAGTAHATPYATPRTSAQLACNLSPRHNPAGHRTWWSRVVSTPRYRDWFWEEILPGGVGCAREVRSAFWERAVPENWNSVANIGGWPWDRGGYFTQTLWLRAIPDDWGRTTTLALGGPRPPAGYYAETFWGRAVPDDWARGYYRYWFWHQAVPKNWAMKPNIGGWFWPVGGYYTQNFWLKAVPYNWAFVNDIGGWPWPRGGYYTQHFWLDAVPDNWAPFSNLKLGRDRHHAAGDQGYYRFFFWEFAVPDEWAPRGNIGGWTRSSGGYYTQWFWLHAVPDDWARDHAFAVSGVRNQGYYHFWTYHYAVPRGFAHRDTYAFDGQRGGSYYHYQLRRVFRSRLPAYGDMWSELQGYLPRTARVDTVNRWFDPAARAVVVLSFDTEGWVHDTQAVAAVLRRHRVPATFMLDETAVQGVEDLLTSTSPENSADHRRAGRSWRSILQRYDSGNHTFTHWGRRFFGVPYRDGVREGLFNMLDRAHQGREIRDQQNLIGRVLGARPISFRLPYCDGHKVLDSTVLRVLHDQGFELDSSMANLNQVNLDTGVLPPADLRHMGTLHRPYPFVHTDASGHALVEVPFVYPSDWAARDLHLDVQSDPRTTSSPTAPELWIRMLEETAQRRGVMALVLHPWVIGPDSLDAFITMAKRVPGVQFTDFSELNRRFRRHRGLPIR